MFLHELYVQCMQIYEVHAQIVHRDQKILQKSGLHEAPPKRNLKNIIVFPLWPIVLKQNLDA